MLSKQIYHFIALTTPKLNLLGLSDYIWDNKKLLYVKSNKPSRKVPSTKFNHCVLLFWLWFCAFQLFRFYHSKQYSNFILSLVEFMALLTALQIFIATIWNANSWVEMKNIFFIFVRHIDGKFRYSFE